jgi:hypothetical protein
MRELGDGKDKDQIEEEFDVGDPGFLPRMPGAQQIPARCLHQSSLEYFSKNPPPAWSWQSGPRPSGRIFWLASTNLAPGWRPRPESNRD